MTFLVSNPQFLHSTSDTSHSSVLFIFSFPSPAILKNKNVSWLPIRNELVYRIRFWQISPNVPDSDIINNNVLSQTALYVHKMQNRSYFYIAFDFLLLAARRWLISACRSEAAFKGGINAALSSRSEKRSF